MREDAKALNFQISEHFKAQNNKFVLPPYFDESSGRIIAMTTQLIEDYNGRKVCEYHFYVRNGNSTCPNHMGECSVWSHKLGVYHVKNTSINTGEIICDENIADCVGQGGYSADARYYIITKDTNIYDSWFGDHVESGGTPYRS